MMRHLAIERSPSDDIVTNSGMLCHATDYTLGICRVQARLTSFCRREMPQSASQNL